jgi:hypothetical protein
MWYLHPVPHPNFSRKLHVSITPPASPFHLIFSRIGFCEFEQPLYPL